jgi:type VI secretion system secreted protein Hcp
MPVDAYLLLPLDTPNMPPSSDAPKDDYFNRVFPKSWFVQVDDFSFSAENPTTVGSATGGAGAGKAKFNELTVKKSVDELSPSLFVISASGGHLSSVQLVVRRAAGGPQGAGRPYLAYEFQMVFITKVEWSGGGDDPVEQVTFAYGALVVGYHPQKPDGSLGQLAKQGWSEVLNKTTGPESLQGF